ncbi:MAG: HlyD family secretion protein [Oscillospiraceae bacterium]|nr:HlyD family secretion protein [Oscillospiraceae bacterium]
MDIKKKIAKRITITFLLIMILVTFSSKTIIYFTTPKVVTVKIQGGQISNDQVLKNISYSFSETTSIKFDKQYSTPLKVSKINSKEGNSVNSGDILITFDTNALSDPISQTQDDLNILKKDLSDFNTEFTRNLEDQLSAINDKSDEIIQLQRQINSNSALLANMNTVINSSLDENADLTNIDDPATLSQNIDADKKQLDKLKVELTRMQEDYNSMKNSGILNGTSVSEIQKNINKKQKELDDLNNLSSNYSTIKAPVNCTIAKIYVQEGDMYDGSAPLLDYRTSDIPTKITANLTDEEYNNLKDYVVTNPKCSIVSFGSTNDGTITGIERKDNNNYMYITMSSFDKLKNINPQNVSIKIQKNSKKYVALIPNEAIFQDSYVYVLNEITGFLGKELIVKKVEIVKGEYNSKYTGVDQGLLGNETIVKGTDREISNGQMVMINTKVTE